MKSIRVFLIVLAFSGGLSIPIKAAESSAIQLLIQKAHSLEGRGRYDLAAQAWQQVLTTDPSEPEALAGLARIAKRTGKNEQAGAYLERLRKIDPHNSALEEIQTLRSAADEQSRLNEAQRLAATHKPDQAMRIYHDVFGDNPPPGGWAIAYYETQASLPGGWETATAALQRLSSEYSAVSEYKLSLGQLLTYRPTTRQSGVSLLESIQGSQSEKSRRAWRQALVWEKANPAFLSSMRAYLSHYQDSELEAAARALSAEVQRTDANRGSVQGRDEQRGYQALKAGDMAEAEKRFGAALTESPASGQALAGMGFVRMKQQNFTGAEQFFEKAKQALPNNKDVADGLETARFWKLMKDGSTALTAGDLDTAITNFKAALSSRPTSPDALQALAGALVKQNNPSEALPLYQRLVQMQSNNADTWRHFIDAKFAVEGADAALSAMHSVPDAVAIKLDQNLEFVARSSEIYAAAGQDALAQKAFDRTLSLASGRDDDLPEDLQVQIAGLMLRHKDSDAAAQSMFKVVDADPGNLDAWQVLLASLVQGHSERKAADVLGEIPKNVYDNGLTRPGFLRSVAAIDAASGKLADAEEALVKLRDSEKATSSPELAGTELQLANVYLKQSHFDKTEELLSNLTDSHPDNADVWKTYSAFLHEKHRDAEVIALRQRMPKKVNARLLADYEYISVLASAQTAVGNFDGAFRLLHEAIARAKSSGEVVPIKVELQLAWMLLESGQRQSELFSILQRAQSRTDLSSVQSREVADLWATWMLRAAETASASGDQERAVSTLTLACRMLPKDDRLKRSLAGYLLKAGDIRRALNVYKNWGLKDGTAADYAGAVGAAMNQRDTTYSTSWLREGLATWPTDSKLLDLAGKQAAASGDYKRARLYWREALKSLPSDESDAASAGLVPRAVSQSSEQLKTLLLGNDPQTNDSTSEALVGDSSATSQLSEIAAFSPAEISGFESRDTETERQVRLASFNTTSIMEPPASPQKVDSTTIRVPPLAGTSKLGNGFVDRNTTQSDDANTIQDQLASIEGRNTPYLGTGDMVQGRSGQPGFDRMLIQQAQMEASATIGDAIRVAVIAKPTYIESGTGTGLPKQQFGTLDSGSLVPMQTASGIAGEAQISSQAFGLRIGRTPEGFLVHNLFGGIRFTPGNGPITFMLDRDSIQDSLLAFAGTRDPKSNNVWGGVMANTASARGSWGNDRSGFYLNAGYQVITGLNVARNTRIDGNFGTYWKAYSRKEGALTIGMNISGMHYDKNLRYFTLGQGGYFSPQQYFLFSVPFRWTGDYKQRLQYTIGASLGSQHFEEDASPYFPTDPSLQGTAGPYYSSVTSTGANYSLEARIAYQIAPNWFIGAWANGNNARDYSSQSTGLFVRYSFQARPLIQDNNVPSIPDWKGQQLFRLF